MKARESWVALACAWLIAFFTGGMIFSIPPILDLVEGDLALTHAQGALIYSAPLLMLTLFATLGGLLADRIGVRRAVGIGATLAGISGLLRGTAPDFLTLLGFTCLYGAGWGLTMPNLPKLVSLKFPHEFVGTATGIYATGITGGAAVILASTVSIVLPMTGSWRGALYFWGVAGLMAATIWWILIREPQANPQGEKLIEERKELNHVWRKRSLWLVASYLFLLNVIFYTLMGWLPAFLVSRGATPTVAANTTSIITFVGTIAIFLGPLISDRIGLRRPFLWLPAITNAAACYALANIPLTYAWSLMVVFGVTLTVTFAVCLILPIEMVESKHVGVASGIILSAAYPGGLLGPLAAGYVMDLTGNFSLNLYILTVLSIALTGFGLTIPETGHKAIKNRH